GVGRGNVDGHVVGQRVYPREAVHVVALGNGVGGVLVLADVDVEQAGPVAACPFDVAHQHVHAAVVEAHPVDHRLAAGQAEQPGHRVAGLRARGHGADLD